MPNTFCLILLPLGTLILALAGCAPEPSDPDASAAERPTLETRADSVAMRAYEAVGGPEAMAALPYLRFDFGVERDGERQTVARHLWNRETGAYRVEWSRGADSNYVALFDVNTQEGRVYLNGDSLGGGAGADRLGEAYRRFINDSYWLLAPAKLFDPGVTRTYVADSSGAEHDVIELTFGDVGLTPGDRYWIYVDKETGQMDRWAFVLQNNPEAPPRMYDWTDVQALETSAGPVSLATSKEAMGGPVTIHTDNLEAPTDVPAEMFTDPNPRLAD